MKNFKNLYPLTIRAVDHNSTLFSVIVNGKIHHWVWADDIQEAYKFSSRRMLEEEAISDYEIEPMLNENGQPVKALDTIGG